jgi:hypothetical protein
MSSTTRTTARRRNRARRIAAFAAVPALAGGALLATTAGPAFAANNPCGNPNLTVTATTCVSAQIGSATTLTLSGSQLASLGGLPGASVTPSPSVGFSVLSSDPSGYTIFIEAAQAFFMNAATNDQTVLPASELAGQIGTGTIQPLSNTAQQPLQVTSQASSFNGDAGSVAFNWAGSGNSFGTVPAAPAATYLLPINITVVGH